MVTGFDLELKSKTILKKFTIQIMLSLMLRIDKLWATQSTLETPCDLLAKPRCTSDFCFSTGRDFCFSTERTLCAGQSPFISSSPVCAWLLCLPSAVAGTAWAPFPGDVRDAPSNRLVYGGPRRWRGGLRDLLFPALGRSCAWLPLAV